MTLLGDRVTIARFRKFEAQGWGFYQPGLYGEQLYGGIRLEQNYFITETGVERLSHFPLDL